MTFRPEHELHNRRFSRNLGVGLSLSVFIALIFALTVVKITKEGKMKYNADEAVQVEVQ
ncbi:MAG: hypothetical protein IT544_01810 [Rhodobacteraceae bacterium]|nr:hypothetical protein [Paracoccaceae bacterium]